MPGRAHVKLCAAVALGVVVYKSLLLAVAASTGPGVDNFTAPVVSRIFFVNLCVFAALLVLEAAERR